MSKANLIQQYEHFRASMVAGINSLEIDQQQKQIFLISLQSFYLQMLLQMPSDSKLISAELIQAEMLT